VKSSMVSALSVTNAMPFRFLGASRIAATGLSAPIPQPPCGRLAGFPLQSLARLTATCSCQTAAMSGWRGICGGRHCEQAGKTSGGSRHCEPHRGEAIQRGDGLGVSPLAAVIAGRHEKALRRVPEGAFCKQKGAGGLLPPAPVP
jgi:hypothetical protein